VVLTPHIAGALGGECLRMGELMVEELKRYLQDQPLRYAVTRQVAALLA
jgi:phosphoglycerate dehydrogenase-like enzyme